MQLVRLSLVDWDTQPVNGSDNFKTGANSTIRVVPMIWDNSVLFLEQIGPSLVAHACTHFEDFCVGFLLFSSPFFAVLLLLLPFAFHILSGYLKKLGVLRTKPGNGTLIS